MVKTGRRWGVHDLMTLCKTEKEKNDLLEACFDFDLNISHRSIAEYVLNEVNDVAFDMKLARLVSDSEDLAQDEKICTALLTRLMIHSPADAVRLLENGVAVDSGTLRELIEGCNEWKIHFLLNNDDDKVRLAIERENESDINYCLKNSSPEANILILRGLVCRNVSSWSTSKYVEYICKNSSIDISVEIDILWEHQLFSCTIFLM